MRRIRKIGIILCISGLFGFIYSLIAHSFYQQYIYLETPFISIPSVAIFLSLFYIGLYIAAFTGDY